MMAPPNMGASSQVGRKTKSIIRAPHETVESEHETIQTEEFIDVDAIPSPHEEPVNPTPVVEEIQAPMASAMEVDPHNGAQGHTADDAGNPQKTCDDQGSPTNKW
jgi:hypothetical protein